MHLHLLVYGTFDRLKIITIIVPLPCRRYSQISAAPRGALKIKLVRSPSRPLLDAAAVMLTAFIKLEGHVKKKKKENNTKQNRMADYHYDRFAAQEEKASFGPAPV